MARAMKTTEAANKWRLISNSDGEIVREGEERTTFRGEKVIVGYMSPPHRAGSTGKVELLVPGEERGFGVMYYPGVIDCHYEECM